MNPYENAQVLKYARAAGCLMAAATSAKLALELEAILVPETELRKEALQFLKTALAQANGLLDGNDEKQTENSI